MLFEDRTDAGQQLAVALAPLRDQDVVVLGLPRGGVAVAAEVAGALHAPLDVIVVRKLGVPDQPELAMGAVAEDGVELIDAEVVELAGVTEAELAAVRRHERHLLTQRVSLLRHGRQRVDLTGRTAIVVDDGLATGASARVACQVARQLGAERVVVAAPVASAQAVRSLTEADRVVCLTIPDRFLAVGSHYRDFRPTTEQEVSALLDMAQLPA